MDENFLTPEVLELLEEIRIAVLESRLADAEQLMIKVKSLVGAKEFCSSKGGDRYV